MYLRTLLVPLLVGCCSFGLTQAQDAPASTSVAESSFADLGRGLNLGNYLENPHPDDWAIKFSKEDYARIKAAGFNNVRIPMNWTAHLASPTDSTIEPQYFQRVDENLKEATDAGLKVIMDDHNDKGMMEDPEATSDRFIAIWKQIAEHYKDQPSTVYFELLNEPIKKMDSAHWNPILDKAITTIRASNPDRTIIVGPVWSYSPAAFSQLVLPESDHHLLVTFHYYSPLKFTHQGAAFVEGAQAWLGTKWSATEDEKKDVADGKDGFDTAAAWAKANNRPIYLGEFGTYLKGDMESRATWTAYIARAAEAHGFSWSYYDYDSGFGVCDPDTHEWIPQLLNALIPKS